MTTIPFSGHTFFLDACLSPKFWSLWEHSTQIILITFSKILIGRFVLKQEQSCPIDLQETNAGTNRGVLGDNNQALRFAVTPSATLLYSVYPL